MASTGCKSANDSAKPIDCYFPARNSKRPRQSSLWKTEQQSSQQNWCARRVVMRLQTEREFGIKIVAYFAFKDYNGMLVSEERRKRKRVALHWPVRLFRRPASLSV